MDNEKSKNALFYIGALLVIIIALASDPGARDAAIMCGSIGVYFAVIAGLLFLFRWLANGGK